MRRLNVSYLKLSDSCGRSPETLGCPIYPATGFDEKMGLGSRDYELVDVLPLKEPVMGVIPYIPAAPSTPGTE